MKVRNRRFSDGAFFRNLLSRYFWQHKGSYSLGFLTVILIDFLEMVPPIILKKISDSLNGEKLDYPIYYYSFAFIGIYFAMALLRFGWRIFFMIPSRSIETDIKGKLFSRILNAKYSEVSKLKVGTTVSLLSQDTGDFRMFMGPGLLIVVDMLAYLVAVPAVLFYYLGYHSLIIMIPMFFIPMLMPYYEKNIHENYEKSSNALGDLSDHVYEDAIGAKIFRVLKLIAIRKSKFVDTLKELFEKRMNVARLDILLEGFLSILSFVSIAIMFLFTYWGLSENPQQYSKFAVLGTVVLSLQLLDKLVWPMMAIAFSATLYQKAKAASKRFRPLYELQPFVNGKLRANDDENSIVIEELYFSYIGSSGNSLKNINFTAKKGQKIGIVGDVGSGKSTLLKVIATLFEDSEIEDYKNFKFNNIEYKNLDVTSVRSRLSFIPQESIIFNESILNNIAPFPRPNMEKVNRAIEMASLSDEIKIFSEGVFTGIGEKGITLSGGQKQRVAIARSFYAESSIHIWDDTISALDVATERKVVQNIFAINPDSILVLATHRPSALMNFDLIYVLSRGEIAEVGNFRELMENKKEFYNLYQYEKKTSELSHG